MIGTPHSMAIWRFTTALDQARSEVKIWSLVDGSVPCWVQPIYPDGRAEIADRAEYFETARVYFPGVPDLRPGDELRALTGPWTARWEVTSVADMAGVGQITRADVRKRREV